MALLPAVFHVGRFIHAAGDFDPQVLVGSVFRYFHLVPFGDLLAARGRKSESRNDSITDAEEMDGFRPPLRDR